MSKKMLIDATHPEETRVVVVDGNKVDDFDFESINKRQLAGNIYLAKVTRVEPSLQAAFVDYGGNRHGFLAFNEIHPDYYQIPVADREALIAEEAAEEEEARRAAEKANGNGGDKAAAAAKPKGRRSRRRRDEPRDAEDGGDGTTAGADASAEKVEAAPEADADAGAGSGGAIAGLEVIDPEEDRADAPQEHGAHVSGLEVAGEDEGDDAGEDGEGGPSGRSRSMPENTGLKDETVSEDVGTATAAGEAEAPEQKPAEEAEAAGEGDGGGRARGGRKPRRRKSRKGKGDEAGAAEAASDDAATDEDARGKGEVDEVGAEDVQEEVAEIRRARRRRYKIQDVVKVRQIMLVQVVKEERGNKGAALTTYLSLAGRYCVLMPNTARGGGISRKITQVSDRKRLREVVSEFEVPKGMGLIVRTAGAERTRAEIKRDYEFLLRQWEQIRELTLKSIAPTLIYEEGSLIKRVIRDLYSKEIDAILVEGEAGYREAKSYMRMLMPSHAKNVQQYQEAIPLFIRYQVESYLNAMFNPTVQLKSGGYIVIGTTEALVAIDVNSGRSTREGSIEETALKTNLEAADEVARQLRLRDLAGLIVIDFIDMDESRNNRSVEKRIKDRLKTDRARIQVGRISAFGLMEMSRQRLRPGMLEATTQPCPHCHGQGIVRSEESLSLAILRELEEEGVRGRSAEVALAAPVEIVNFLVNHKRQHLNQIEERYGMVIMLEGTPALTSPNYTIERSRTASRPALSVDEAVITAESAAVPEVDAVAEVEVEAEAKPAGGERERARAADGGEDDGGGRRRRGKRGGRRRRGRGGGADQEQQDQQGQEQEAADARGSSGDDESAEGDGEAGQARGRRRRGKRGGRDAGQSEQVERTGETAGEGGDQPLSEVRAAAEGTPVGEAAEAPAGEAPAEPAAEAASFTDSEAPAEPTVETAAEEAPEASAPDRAAPAPEPEERPGAEIIPGPEEQTAETAEAAPEVKAARPEEPAATPAPAAGDGDGRADAAAERAGPVEREEPDEAAEGSPDDPDRPKRRGWWSLGSFR